MSRKRREKGTLTERAPGVWMLQIPNPDRLSEKKRLSKRFHGSEIEAEKALVDWIAESEIPDTVNALGMRLDYAYEHIYEKRMSQLAKSTQHVYRSSWDTYIYPAFGGCTLREMRPALIQQKLDEIEKPWPRFHAFKMLRAMLTYLYDLEYMREKPMERVHVPEPRSSPLRPITMHDVNVYMRAMHGFRYEASAICLCAAGLRRGECLALRWTNVEIRNNEMYLYISHSRSDTDGITDAKTPKSLRIVPVVDDYAVQRMAELRESSTPNAWLSPGRKKGMPVSASYFYHQMREWCAMQGIDFIRPKDLRSAYATALLESGVQDSVVQQIMGHEKLTTTYEHYYRQSLAAAKSAAHELSRALAAD